MLYGLYLSAQGADAQSTRLEVIANNLANAQTTAFKRDLALVAARDPFDIRKSIPSDPPGNLNDSTGGTEVVGVMTDFSDAAHVSTGRRLDLAINGPGFFRVSDGQNEYLTRNGALTRDRSGQLVTAAGGNRVLSAGGAPIQIPTDARDIDIAEDGTVFQITEGGGRSSLGQIALVEPQSFNALTKVGNSLYAGGGEVVRANPQTSIKQGFLESSGTSSVHEMMQLIEASRAFESNINMIRFQDDALGQLLQSVSRQ